MMEVIIDGVVYVPKAGIPPLNDDKKVQALRSLVSLYYFDDWHKAPCRVFEAIEALSPDIAKLVGDHPGTAYELLEQSIS